MGKGAAPAVNVLRRLGAADGGSRNRYSDSLWREWIARGRGEPAATRGDHSDSTLKLRCDGGCSVDMESRRRLEFSAAAIMLYSWEWRLRACMLQRAQGTLRRELLHCCGCLEAAGGSCKRFLLVCRDRKRELLRCCGCSEAAGDGKRLLRRAAAVL